MGKLLTIILFFSLSLQSCEDSERPLFSSDFTFLDQPCTYEEAEKEWRIGTWARYSVKCEGIQIPEGVILDTLTISSYNINFSYPPQNHIYIIYDDGKITFNNREWELCFRGSQYMQAVEDDCVSLLYRLQ